MLQETAPRVLSGPAILCFDAPDGGGMETESNGIDTLTGVVGHKVSHGLGCDAAFPPDSKRPGTKILEDATWQKMALD